MTAHPGIFDEADREHLLRVLDYTAKWAAAELLSGLLAHPQLYAALAAGSTPEHVALTTGLTARQASALLRSLEVEDVVTFDGTSVTLTPFGRSLGTLRGWLDLFVRGYSGFFHHADALWRGTVESGWRNVREVGLASVRMSEHDALPMVTGLMDDLRPHGSRVIDVGCANGTYLVRLCEQRPHLTGIGVERDPALVDAARRLVCERGLQARVTIAHTDGCVFPDVAADFVVFAFVLQELVEQISLEATADLMADLGRRYRDAWFLVVEVDAAGRHDPERMRRSAQRRGYYNAYYLVHDLTEQRLLSFSEWRALWRDAGFEVARERTIHPSVDDTGLTAGFALRYAGG